MNFYPEGTCLYQEKNIKYQIYSEEFYEQTLQCIVDSRTEKGTIYSDFSIDRESIVRASEQFLKEAIIKVIAVDISKEVPEVVGQLLGEDFTSFERGQKTVSTNKKVNILKQINIRLMAPITSMQYKNGDILIGSGYGVKKGYQNQNIGQILNKLFINVCTKTSYKIICGLFYSRKAAYISVKSGCRLMAELSVESCLDIDEQVASYMRNGVQIAGFLDTTKDLSSLRMPQNSFIQPSL